jgi:hypothetical protein
MGVLHMLFALGDSEIFWSLGKVLLSLHMLFIPPPHYYVEAMTIYPIKDPSKPISPDGQPSSYSA